MNLAFFVEGQSEKEMLKGLLPRLLPEWVEVKYVVFEGKQDLKSHMKQKLNRWHTPNTVFVVLCDQDSSDCVTLKAELITQCPRAKHDRVIIRIACRELESWYFGDLAAVEQALGISNLIQYQRKSKYREPDTIHSPANELTMITKGAYQKKGGSRKIGQKLSLSSDSNTSRSFQVFIECLQRLAQADPTPNGKGCR